jgi:protein TonB
VQTSGSSDLDQTTCRLIERRFRYLPALGPDGRPIAQTEIKDFFWGYIGRDRGRE